MTRKDYVLISKTINHHLANMGMSGKATSKEFEAVGAIAHKLARELERENPRFDRDKFLDACGVPSYALKY